MDASAGGDEVKISTVYGEEETITHYCKKCKTTKPITDFTLRDRASNGMQPYNSCKECDKTANKQLVALKKTIPKPESDHICPLCLRGKAELGYTSAFVLEHSHESGEFRGWVCHDCNTAIARIHDNPETARRMSDYLSKGRTLSQNWESIYTAANGFI